MENLSDLETLKGLKNKENAAYEILYKFYYPVVEKFVLRNSGTNADAQDIFQDTIIVLLKKVPHNDFELTSSLKTYIFAISSNLWLKRLRKAKQNIDLYFENNQDLEQHNILSDLVIEEQKQENQNVIANWLKQIGIHCRDFLRAVFFLEKKAEELGYKNKHTAQNQQYKCLQKVRKIVDVQQ